MCNIQGNTISWVATRGNAPYIEEYLITVNVRTIIGAGKGMPQYRESSIISVTLPADYPRGKPKTLMKSSQQPFHPNWWPDGRWCEGSWAMSEGLGDYVIRMVKTLQFDPDITNEHSPANGDAKIWYILRKNSGIFPCDRTKLPDPSTSNSGMMVGNSGFVIKRRS